MATALISGASNGIGLELAKIHAAKGIDEILTEVSNEICDLFAAERITIYLVRGF